MRSILTQTIRDICGDVRYFDTSIPHEDPQSVWFTPADCSTPRLISRLAVKFPHAFDLSNQVLLPTLLLALVLVFFSHNVLFLISFFLDVSGSSPAFWV